MKLKNYKGFAIEAKVDKALGGWDNTYYSLIHLKTGLTIEDGISQESVSDQIEYLKDFVDYYHENNFYEWVKKVTTLAKQQGLKYDYKDEQCEMIRYFIREARPDEYLATRGLIAL